MGCSGSKDGSAATKKPKSAPGTVEVGDWLKEPDQLTDFPVFPKQANSALSRNLTKEIWNELKDQKDDCGVSFKTCIFSGCKNIDSGIGVYAGSQSSYNTFASLFDKVIEEYHKHPKDAKHVSNMDAAQLDAPPLPEEDAARIVSTRIRVGRNLDGFPLGPGVSKEQRDQIMDKVVQACDTFTGDLSGKFYALSDLSDDDRKQLIADHFLFK